MNVRSLLFYILPLKYRSQKFRLMVFLPQSFAVSAPAKSIPHTPDILVQIIPAHKLLSLPTHREHLRAKPVDIHRTIPYMRIRVPANQHQIRKNLRNRIPYRIPKGIFTLILALCRIGKRIAFSTHRAA